MAGEGVRPIFDAAAFGRQTGGDPNLRREIIQMFLEDCPARVEAIRTAIGNRDQDALVEAAHSLKGACGYLSAVSAREEAALLEQIGRQGRVDQQAFTALERLDAAVTELMSELRKHLS
jgi:HPt (histidine-containing phosphotransfer) domain-containing protein